MHSTPREIWTGLVMQLEGSMVLEEKHQDILRFRPWNTLK